MDKKDLPITVGIRGNLLSTDPKRYSVVSTDRVIATRVTQQDAEYIVRLCQQDIFAQEHGLGRLHYCGKCHDQAAEIERLKEKLCNLGVRFSVLSEIKKFYDENKP